MRLKAFGIKTDEPKSDFTSYLRSEFDVFSDQVENAEALWLPEGHWMGSRERGDWKEA